MVSSCSASEPLNPSNLPTIPEGFGTGHSCAAFLMTSSSSPGTAGPGLCTSDASSPSALELGLSFGFILLLRPSSNVSNSESAKRTRGAGHGTMCGMATTRNETAKVAPNKEEVRRDRGWRWGVMVDDAGEDLGGNDGSMKAHWP